MKVRLKHSLHLCLIVSALLLTACGKKDNKVGTYTGSSPFSTSNPVFNTSVGSTIVNQVQSIKANVACLNGGYRLTNDVSFYVNGGVVSGSKIGGNWTPGFMTSGTVNKMWVGVGAYRDLMFVTQVTSGSKAVGFNVTLSFCELKNGYSGIPSLLSNERAIDSFQAQYGIVLGSDTYCGYNVVDSAQETSVISRRSSVSPQLTSDVRIFTSYTKPSCNGQF